LADRISQNWEQLNGFSLNYCTDSIDPTGAGAQLQVSFYQDYTPCTSPGVPDCTYILSGLPLSMNGNATCWSISVDLSGMECMPGLSTPFPTEDLNGASRSAGITLEFLLPAGAIGSIGPMIGGTNGYGNLDQFWVNDPSGASTGCRSWNGNPYSSFGFALQAPHAGARNYFGTLPLLQPMPLLELLPRQAVQAGSPATWDILHGGSGYFWMAASLQFGQQLILGAGALEGIGLIAPPLLSPPIPMPGASVTLPVPLAFSGKIVFLQAVETSTPSFAIPAITGISQGLLLQL
jgi:hypothetical protein